MVVRAAGTEQKTPTIDNDLNPIWKAGGRWGVEVREWNQAKYRETRLMIFNNNNKKNNNKNNTNKRVITIIIMIIIAFLKV